MNIPKGYKLVPVEPTEEILTALINTWFAASTIDDQEEMAQAYKAMLAAAPTPPLPIYDEDADRSACRKEWKRRNEHSHFEPIPFPDYWAGWKDCAQSRAKSGEVGNEQ